MDQTYKMDVVTVIQEYINKMISNVQGMKVFLLDRETMKIVSMVFSQSQVLQKEVFLFENLEETKRSSMMHLKAICFLRPTEENRSLLETEFKNPKYGEYHLYFSNIASEKYIRDIAIADKKECVHQFQEYYADYFAVNRELFSFNVDRLLSPKQREWRILQERTVEGIASVLLSLKKQPLIRYSAKSEVCERICQEYQRKVQSDQALFDFPGRTKVPPLLLIYDRRDDPVTPLLTQWTYQAMAHDLIGIQNNKEIVVGTGKSKEHLVLSGAHDEWFKKSMFLNKGELSTKLQTELVDDLAAKSAQNKKTATIGDLKNILDGYSEYKKQSMLAAKHVNVISELDRISVRRNLLAVSELEQNIANTFDHASHVQWVKDAINEGASGPPDPSRKQPITEQFEQLKLALLYALKYEDNPNNEIQSIRNLLEQKGHSRESLSLIDGILRYAGKQARSGEVFAKSSIMGAIASMGKGFREEEIIYTQHKPYIKNILDQLFTNKLKESDYAWFGPSTTQIPQEVIIFVVGGATYEEACFVHSFNKTSNFRVLLGGTTIHNSRSFLEDVSEFYKMAR